MRLPHEKYTKAPVIKVTNTENGHSNEINLYDLINGLQDPLQSPAWAAMWFDFKSGLLEFDIVKK